MRSSGLGPGAISGAELQALSDEELKQRLPDLHVFGRVTPQDKLRLARAMQEQGMIVAMTGDAVNDAAALKQADIGVAMGSGSEVTKQAARMVLTDDNFGTLVHAVGIGRRVYAKVVSYVRYQMTQLLSLVFLFLAATVFNINQGVAMTPTMVLYLLFFATAVGVVIIAVDPGDPDVMHRPPRDPAVTDHEPGRRDHVGRSTPSSCSSPPFLPFVAGPDEPSPNQASVSMTMTFVVMGLGTAFNALVNRRDPTSGLTPPILKALAIALVPGGNGVPRHRSCRRCRAACSPSRSPGASGSSVPAWPRCSRSSSSWARWSGGAVTRSRSRWRWRMWSRRPAPGASRTERTALRRWACCRSRPLERARPST